MASIQPFSPIRPNPFYADQLVFTKPQAESVSGDYTKEGGLKPLKTLLETGARQRPETPEGQEMAYGDIKNTLQNLLENDQLNREKSPCIFIYEIVHETYSQTGVWALTSLEDYRKGDIKIHELTFDDSVRRLKNYRANTRLEGSPILLTYPPDAVINRIISETKVKQPETTLGNENGLHQLWKIDDREIQQMLIGAFSRVKTVYLADGHHRIESANKLALEQKEQGKPVYDTISSLYMATGQLRIEEYNRVVIPEKPVEKAELLMELDKDFDIRKSTAGHPVQPKEIHHIGMYLDKEWYHLLGRPHTRQNKNEADNLDAAILQQQVLTPVFNINDPKTDSRLKCAGGEKAMEEIETILLSHPAAIAFTLCPLTVDQLIRVADAGHTLPPKSTWIVPKIPYGLVIQQH
ncbi:MAG TPA: hypothetical protein DCO83_15940 [Mucilaginibacter sp.]|jgi:uncharacterized protein (DUF1015 family)|nr:hypothetical protein [Mucilaginibacter sp.]